jgi:hypothetical protein
MVGNPEKNIYFKKLIGLPDLKITAQSFCITKDNMKPFFDTNT